jgi:hypothetical protein
MKGTTSISTVSPVDVGVGSFPLYIYVPTSWVKAHQNYRGGAPSLENLSCSKLDIFSPSRVIPRPRPFRWMEVEDEVFAVLPLVRNIFVVSSF